MDEAVVEIWKQLALTEKMDENGRKLHDTWISLHVDDVSTSAFLFAPAEW
jgi:hypothetical protein